MVDERDVRAGSPVTPQRYEAAQEVFLEICDLLPEECEAALQKRCPDDPLMQDLVRSLLAAEASSQALFEQESVADGIREVLTDALAASPATPESVGPYRLLAKIGEGGMGLVYKAVHDVTRRAVALKMIRAGLTSAHVLRRFQHESEILGLLQHPGIAQVFDAGVVSTTEGPQPYFAMELIQGKPLLQYAERAQLGIRQRLQLFAEICDAIQHAHTKGVIHRDLKPANILVTDTGQPKILDFGVARLTDSDIKATTLKTELQQLIGTIPYISPEQAGGDSTLVDARSDVYSLGVLLYQLLTDRLPYDLRKKMLHEAALIIQQEDPTPLASLNRALRGDLETIVNKALDKRPEHRYQTAAELAADTRRFLNDEPVVARPASAVYQFRKFAKRNKTLVGSVVAILIALVGGLAGIAWGMSQAVAQRNIAEAEAERARLEAAKYEHIARFTQEILSGIDPAVARDQDTSLLVAILENAETRIDTELSIPEVEAAVRHTIGLSYAYIAEYERAEGHLESALELARQSLGDDDPETVEALNSLGVLYMETGRLDEAEPLLAAATTQRRRLLGDEDLKTIQSIDNLGALYAARGQYDLAEPLHREALELSTRALGEDHVTTFITMNNLAMLYKVSGDYEQARPLAVESLERRRRVLGDDDIHTLAAANNLALIHLWFKEFDEAERLLQYALEGRERMLGVDHPRTLTTVHNLAIVAYRQGRSEDAIALFQRALTGRQQVLGDSHPKTASTARTLGRMYDLLKRPEEASPLFEAALAARTQSLGERHPQTMESMHDVAVVNRRLGRYDEAAALFSRVAALRKEVLGEASKHTQASMMGLAKVYLQQRRFEEAESAWLEVYDLIESDYGADASGAKVVAQQLVELYEAWGKTNDAAHWSARIEEASSEGSGAVREGATDRN